MGYQDILDKLGQAFIKANDNEVKPGDESQVANNLQNYLIEKAGLPKEWQSTVAQDKDFYKNLPQQMGTASMGTVGKVESLAPEVEALAQKIGPTSTAQAIAESKAAGNTVHVVPDAAERIANQNALAGKPRFGKIILK